MIIVYVTFPNKEEAVKLSNKLMEAKLIACVNIFPVDAASQWLCKGAWGPENVAIFKTKKQLVKKVEQFILANHPYQVPCIFSIDVPRVNEKYDKWVEDETE